MDDANEQLEKLSRIKRELEEQDALLLGHLRRTPYDAVNDTQIAILRAIFEEADVLNPGLTHRFAATDDASGLLPQIRSARARVDEQIAKLQKTIKMLSPEVPTIEIFIGHSSRDEELVKRLITLIRSAFVLPSHLIRCTSVDGFRLSAGMSTDEALRREIHESLAFVAILTPSAITSTYVLFELGARWGARKPLIPLLGNGATGTGRSNKSLKCP